MAISGAFFIIFRILQFVVTIPILGMLAYFVHGYVVANQLTPTYILLLFITSVLAAAWELATLFTYVRARHNATFVALVDLAFVGTLIAAVYLLRFVTGENCSNLSTGYLYVALDINKTCAMIKACFALAIILIILFFITFLLALLLARHFRDDDKVVVRREYHSSRHNSRRSPRGSYDRGHRGSSRSGSRTRRSGSRSRRTYYV